MFDEKGRLWLAAAVRGPDNPAFCKKGSDQPSAKLFPIEQSHRQLGDARPEDDEVHLRRYLLRHPSSAVRLRRQQHAVGERRRPGAGLAQHQDVRRDRRCRERRRAGRPSCSTPTATASATGLCRAEPAGRSGQGQAHRRRLLCGDAEPGRRLGLGHRRHVRRHGRHRARRSGSESAGDGIVRNLQHAAAGLRPARRRHRQQGRGLGVARQRPSRQLRPAANARGR